RAMAERIGPGRVVAIDRSARAVAQAEAAGSALITAGRLAFLRAEAEDFTLPPDEPPFDLAVAIRVGALDGRHPEAGIRALPRIAAALVPGGRLFIDGGSPLRELPLPALSAT